MLQNTFKPQELTDALFAFDAGSNRGIAPLLIPKNQLAAATNSTVRGSFVRPRSTFRKMELDFGGDAAVEQGVDALWQGLSYYQPDSGAEKVIASIAGRWFDFTPGATSATVIEIPITGGPNDATKTQVWMWQAEKWIIGNDGSSWPIFYDGTTARRSNASTGGNELKKGRMGVYGMGRNWYSLTDGKQFVGADLVGSSSGTVGNNFRDAVLKQTQNTFLNGGGYFTVPGSIGSITAMRFIANLDASLGQGPLQVCTHKAIFSCNAPVDNLTWQSLTNPILTESLITNGALSQNSTIIGNSDLIFRSLDGIRSLILGRREFNTWGNTPQSNEMRPVLDQDSPDLLRYSSAIVFDNRLLMTAMPTPSDRGVYHKRLITLNFDTISTLRGKAPSVYDDVWTGLNVLQLVVGEFSGVERAFAFCTNTVTNKLELYEILNTDDAIYDFDGANRRIVWHGESPVLFNYPQNDPRRHELKEMLDGEIHVDKLVGKVDFQIFYKPDQYPCWIPWHKWQECALVRNELGQFAPVAEGNFDKPQFRPRMGLGQPSINFCDPTTNRPMRQFVTAQVKWVIVGQCEIVGMFFKAVTCPQNEFAPMICDPICPDEP